MSYSASLLIHVTGIMLLFAAFGGMAFHAANGGTKATNPSRGLMAALHGVGLLLILGGGFMMFTLLGISHGGPWPTWVMIKMGIWVLLGAWTAFFGRSPKAAVPLLLAAILLGVLSGYMARFKPGAVAEAAETANAEAEASAE